MNAGRYNTANIIFPWFWQSLWFWPFYVFFLYQSALKMFSNNFEITYIFQCLIIHFHLIHVSIVSTNLYLKHDSVCNYTFTYRNIQVRRRIGIIFGSFIRAPSWCDAGWHFAVAPWNWNIQEIRMLNLFLDLKIRLMNFLQL